MSKILFVCFKEFRTEEFSDNNIRFLSKRLEPDNISFSEPRIITGENELIAVFNPNDSIIFHEKSLCHGTMINPPNDWWKPSGQVPDGSYVLYRSSKLEFEIVTDIVASKSVWYYFDDNIFISSTSQRAIIFFLRSFKFNKAVIPWMLATGSLGPGYSWDKRLRLVKGDSSIILDRDEWELKSFEGTCIFQSRKNSIRYHKEKLLDALQNTVGALNLDYSKWVLPLSGGYDSRGILYLLKNTIGLKSITWGVEKSLNEKLNDAYVAKKVAEKFKIDHEYYLTDISNEPISIIFNRYLVCGEGRVDHIEGYMDGFKIWKDLFENSITGVIRGDEGFGFIHVFSDFDVRMRLGIPELTDYVNLVDIHDYGIEKLDVPQWMFKKQEETKETWFDRIYQLYRLPHVIAALNEIKLTYVEVITPLLTKQTIDVVRQLPDELRYHKKLFRKIVNLSGPRMPFAKYDAINSPADIFENKEVVDEIISEIKSKDFTEVLPLEFRIFILNKLSVKKDRPIPKKYSVFRIIKSFMPENLKRLLRNTVLKKEMDFNILAFRSYIISKMFKMLTEDAKIIDMRRG